MHPLLEYIIKANGLLLFFWLFYRLFLNKETFYSANRWYFLTSIAISIVAPLITFTKTMYFEAPQSTIDWDRTASINTQTIKEAQNVYSFEDVAILLIVLFSLFLFLRTIYQLTHTYLKIQKLPHDISLNARRSKIDTVFSLYPYIVIPHNFEAYENTEMILAHEQVHVEQKHSFDMILMQLLRAIFWMNPLLSYLQKDIEGNLEYIVDEELQSRFDSKTYQKSLLSFHTNPSQQFVNSYNSQLKKRLLQINSKKSTKMKKLKFLLATPAIVSFFTMFQVETIAQVKEIKLIEVSKTQEPNQTSKNTSDSVGSIHLMQGSDKENDYFMLLGTVQNDLEVLKKDRKTFDKVASKFPIYIDGLLMTKKQLKKFDTSKIQSAHIDSGNPENGTILKLSTIANENSDSRMFTFKLADDNDQKLLLLKDHKQTLVETEKPYNKIIIDGKEVTEEELQNFYRTATNFQARNENKVIIIETNNNKNKELDNNKTVTLKVTETNNNVLYIVDGKEMNNDDFRKIHPNDIESINVLKDKNKTEIYGDKAKDGVLLITTKTKKSALLESKAKISKERESALKRRNELTVERSVIEKKQKQLLKKKEELKNERIAKEKGLQVSVKSNSKTNKNLKNDFKTVSNLFYDVKKDLKKIEDEHFKITNITTSLKYDNGEEITMQENF